eukprot:2238208-Alexandrium_andersonii.AAC.1
MSALGPGWAGLAARLTGAAVLAMGGILAPARLRLPVLGMPASCLWRCGLQPAASCLSACRVSVVLRMALQTGRARQAPPAASGSAAGEPCA